MQDPALNTLFQFLETKPSLPWPGKRSAFVRSRWHPRLKGVDRTFEFYQSFRPFAQTIEDQGYAVSPVFRAEDSSFGLILYLPTQSREENLVQFGLGFRALADDGVMICSLSNDLGAGRFEKHLAALFGNIESFSKNKCRAFLARKDSAGNDSLLSEYLTCSGLRPAAADGLFTQPGIFSWDRNDAGSLLLMESLSAETFSGRGADLGAGNGLLTKAVLDHCPGVEHVELFEAEYLALEAAKHGLRDQAGRLSFHWHDVTRGIPAKNLDWIIMNPPFHQSRKADAEIGVSFIEAASRALKKEGRLLMVANEHLPYETALKETFRKAHTFRKERGYKLIEAIR
jgi:16S rRNA (guanine1207-N2)-methyltransferase